MYLDLPAIVFFPAIHQYMPLNICMFSTLKENLVYIVESKIYKEIGLVLTCFNLKNLISQLDW